MNKKVAKQKAIGKQPLGTYNFVPEEVVGNKGVNMKCSVKDYKGNNCPENANHNFIRNNELVSLCDKCFVNYRNGAYGDSFTSDNSDYEKCSHVIGLICGVLDINISECDELNLHEIYHKIVEIKNVTKELSTHFA